MAVKIKYFVHGTTKDNENHIASGWNDVQLSSLGIQQSIHTEAYDINASGISGSWHHIPAELA